MFENKVTSPHSTFVEKHSSFVQELRNLDIKLDRSSLSTVHLVNGDELQYNFFMEKAERQINCLRDSDDKIKTDVFKGYLKKIGFNEEKIKEAETKNLVYAYETSLSNTQCTSFADHNFIFLDNKERNIPVAGNTMFSNASEELKKELSDKKIDLFSVSKSRGTYHEATHTLGTDDEKKCDVFAILKILQDNHNPSKPLDNMCIADFVASARTNGVMYPLACIAKGDDSYNWHSYIMTKTFVKLKEDLPEILKSENFSKLDGRGLMDLTCKLVEGTGYSKEENAEITKALSENFNFESLHKEPFMQDIFKLKGLADKEEQREFLEDSLIYHGAFEVLIDGGKDIENKLLSDPNKTSEVVQIMEDFGIKGSVAQDEFLKRNKSYNMEISETKKKDMEKAEKNHIFEKIKDLKSKGFEDKGLQLETSKALVDYNWNKINDVCKRYKEDPCAYFDSKKSSQNAEEVKFYESRCNKAGTLSKMLVFSHSASKDRLTPVAVSKFDVKSVKGLAVDR